MNFSALKFEPHTILKAYAVLFGAVPAGSMLFLDRKSLKSQWEAKARRLSSSKPGAGWKQRSNTEDTLDFEELDWAYHSLLELLDGQEQAVVSGWACESIDAVNAVLQKSRDLAPAARSGAMKESKPVGSTAQRPRAKVLLKARGVSRPTGNAERLEIPRVDGNAPGPRLRLMFGRFLLARGHITLQQLIDAVRWQRAQRPPVGRIAMSWGILSANQVYEILSDKNPEDRFCDVAVRKGYMTGFQRLAVLGRQREMQKPIGTYFVEQGILTRDEIEGLAAEAQGQ